MSESGLSGTLDHIVRAMSFAVGKLFIEDLTDLFVVVKEPAPNRFAVSVSFFLDINGAEKQQFLLERLSDPGPEDRLPQVAYDTVESLAGAALNLLQLDSIERGAEVPGAARFYFSTLDDFVHVEMLPEDEPVRSARAWVQSVIAQEEAAEIG